MKTDFRESRFCDGQAAVSLPRDPLLNSVEEVPQMTRVLNAFVNLLKWPIALIMLYLLPGFAGTFFFTLIRAARNYSASWPLVAGFAGLYILYRNGLKQAAWFRWLCTFEHEAGHALFAILSGHRVTRFSVGAGSGRVNYLGPGNWLIIVAPYFFPFWLPIVLGVIVLTGTGGHPVALAVSGAVFAATILRMIQDFDPRQPDIRQLRILFAAIFIPAADFAIWGMFLHFMFHGGAGFSMWLNRIGHYNRWFYDAVANLTGLGS